MLDIIKTAIINDLLKVKTEIESYKDESKIWIIEGGILNSAGNLCLHLVGNLNHFIGATLGNTGYVRNRELEFSEKNISVFELVRQIDDTVSIVQNTFERLSNKILDENFPLLFRDQKVTTSFMLLNLIAHLNYHLGQINYHRRLLDK